MSMGDSKSDALHPPSYERGVAAERARCLKVLGDLCLTLDNDRRWIRAAGVALALEALEAATPPPVLSSPVGGEQHG